MRKRKICCRQCFAFIPFDSRKCEFCGCKYKSPGKYLFDKIKHALKIHKVYSLDKSKTADKDERRENFFTAGEIEVLLDPGKFRILMYLILDEIAFVDETSLIQLGETLSLISEN